MLRFTSVLLVIVGLLLPASSCSNPTTGDAVLANAKAKNNEPVRLNPEQMGTVNNVHSFGNVYLAGQFEPDDIELLKEKEIAIVISLRTDGEIDWDERKMLEDAGIKFVNVPFRSPESLSDEVFEQVRNLLKENNDQGLMVHCKSANRVGAVWAAVRACDQGLDVDSALSEGQEVGLRSPDYADKVRDYILRQSNSK